MSKDKRNQIYFWIKLRQELMQSKEIKLLMRQQDGGWYFSIYIYLIMLSINSEGKLIQKVNDMEMIYDLVTITQELMFFKIDTIRVAMEILRNLGLLYEDEEGIICISNFDKLVGQETGWAELKRKRRSAKLIETVDNVHIDVHDNVHAIVHTEYRDKSIEYRDKNKELRKNDFNDFNDNNDSITLTSEFSVEESINKIMINEWHREFNRANLFTKYLVYSKYLEEGDLDTLNDANVFFEKYLDELYSFEELKKHIQYFLYQYRKLPIKEKKKIKNKLAYLTNAIKNNQRSIEWRESDEFKELQNVHNFAEKLLSEQAKIMFPNDVVRQELFISDNYLSMIGKQMRIIKDRFNKRQGV